MFIPSSLVPSGIMLQRLLLKHLSSSLHFSLFLPQTCETLLPSARIFQCDIQEINRSALDKDTELPFFWAYVDSADPTSCIVKVPMHCYYGDRGALAHARMAGSGADCHGMRQNAPGLLASMDKTGAVGFEYHIRARHVADSSESHPPVIRLMRPGLVPKTGNIMGTGAHCTNLLQPGTWSGRLSVKKRFICVSLRAAYPVLPPAVQRTHTQ